jgi:dTDP-glucose 4,6-dehydratase
MRLLITGGMGFIGSNFIRHMLVRHPGYKLYNLDLLTYAAHPDNLRDVDTAPGYRFIHGDVCDTDLVRRIMGEGIEAIVHFAAESHVDRSIANPGVFLRTNVQGTQSLLEAARAHGVKRFIHVSTDEVYGSLGREGSFTEQTPLAPNSPYAASKASADLLARAYYRTYGLPVITTRCSNNYGPRQFPEKLVPLALMRALEDVPVPLYGDGLNVRDWLYVDDHCAAVDLALHRGIPGEIYNIGGGNELTNIALIRRVLAELGKPESLICYVPDRPGHDRRYAIDATKLQRELGWLPAVSFDEGIRRTLEWYKANAAWREKATAILQTK